MENPGYCQTCNKTFKGKRGLSQHNRRTHPVEIHQRQALEIEQRDITLNNRIWTLGETREMARLEANLLVINKSNIIISLQSSIKNRTYDAIKSHRRTADYKNLVSQLKNSLAPQPDNIAFTPTISNTPPSSPSPSHSPLNINAHTFIQLNNLEQNNIIDYILEINNTKNISLHEISYENLVISSSISQNDIDRDYDYLLTNIDKIKIHRKQIQTLSTISTDRPITTETRTPTMCYSTIMKMGLLLIQDSPRTIDKIFINRPSPTSNSLEIRPINNTSVEQKKRSRMVGVHYIRRPGKRDAPLVSQNMRKLNNFGKNPRKTLWAKY